MRALPPELFHPADSAAALRDLLSDRAGRPGAELRWVRVTLDGVPALVRAAGPAILTCFHEDQPPTALLLLGPAGPLGAPLLDREGRVRRVPVAAVVAAVCAGLERAHAPPIEALLDEAGLRGRQRERARQRLMADRLRGAPLGGIALLSVPPEGPLWAQARELGLFGPMLTGLWARFLATALGLVGWWLIGAGSGSFAASWVWGWALLLLTGLLLERLAALAQGRLALRGSTWIKQALLRGAMRTDPERFRQDGVGGVLARVQESQALEDLVLSGGLGAVLAVVDLAAAAWILSMAPGAWALLGLLALVTVALALAALRLRRLQGDWTDLRRGLTHRLVEDMVGHRTRLTQAEPARLHVGEDEALSAYHALSRRLDQHRVIVEALLSGGFMLPALAIVGAMFTLGGTTPGGMALALGGALWARGALSAIAGSLGGLVSASISARDVRDLLSAARTTPEAGNPALAAAPVAPGQVILRARGLGFGWPGRKRALQGVDLTLRAGDRVLITGPSGGGKSTLVALLSGQRAPDEGVLLLGGLDRTTLGAARWQKRVVAAPQFHENHVFESSLAFNLLLGREWPASPEELDQALALCEALGLDEMIARMPAGMGQPVGASGWQMSHGERSRVFLARALLQGAEVVVLDESFAALDPVTLRRCLAVAEARAPTLLVVAHPG